MINASLKNTSEHVDAWLSKVHKSQESNPSQEITDCFKKMIQTIWNRSSNTLSDVTLLVIFDRALINAVEKYPLLSKIQVNRQTGLIMDHLVAALPVLNENEQAQVIPGLRLLIIELITIIGNLTAEILTEPLYQELCNYSHQGTPQATNGKLNGSRQEDL